LVVVNCEAGLSRSAGIALALSQIIEGHDSEICQFNGFFPNMLVRDKIVKFGKCLATENTPLWFRSLWAEEDWKTKKNVK
jgi:hypothetical protein